MGVGTGIKKAHFRRSGIRYNILDIYKQTICYYLYVQL